MATRVRGPLNTSDAANRSMHVMSFAKKHRLVYFSTIEEQGVSVPIIEGSALTSTSDDHNISIGTHAGYDLTFVERFNGSITGGNSTSAQYWYVLEIDLKTTLGLPYVFVGTTQQSKAYYANVLTKHPDCRYIKLETHPEYDARFHARHAIIASRSSAYLIHRLFDTTVMHVLTSQSIPFSIEIDGDSLYIVTEAKKPNEQLIAKLLHFGLWFAKRIDEKLG